MKIYKISWTIKESIPLNINSLGTHHTNSKDHVLLETYKFTTSKERAETLVKELEKSAAHLGIPKFLFTNIKEESADE